MSSVKIKSCIKAELSIDTHLQICNIITDSDLYEQLAKPAKKRSLIDPQALCQLTPVLSGLTILLETAVAPLVTVGNLMVNTPTP